MKHRLWPFSLAFACRADRPQPRLLDTVQRKHSFCLLLIIGLFVSSTLVAQAESPLFVIQETKQGQRPQPAQPQWDTASRSTPGTTNTPRSTPFFSIQETRRYVPPPAPSGPGIVGLDMLIYPDRYPIVQQVFPGTPAAHAGMKPGDAIVSVNGVQAIGRSQRQVDMMISDVPGDIVDLAVERNGELKYVRLKVMALSEVSAQVQPVFSDLFP